MVLFPCSLCFLHLASQNNTMLLNISLWQFLSSFFQCKNFKNYNSVLIFFFPMKFYKHYLRKKAEAIRMVKTVDIFWSILNNLAFFRHCYWWVVLPATPPTCQGIGEPSSPKEGPYNSALSKNCSFLEMHSHFAACGSFFSSKSEVSCEADNPRQSQRIKGLLINSETCGTSTSGKAMLSSMVPQDKKKRIWNLGFGK